MGARLERAPRGRRQGAWRHGRTRRSGMRPKCRRLPVTRRRPWCKAVAAIWSGPEGLADGVGVEEEGHRQSSPGEGRGGPRRRASSSRTRSSDPSHPPARPARPACGPAARRRSSCSNSAADTIAATARPRRVTTTGGAVFGAAAGRGQLVARLGDGDLLGQGGLLMAMMPLAKTVQGRHVDQSRGTGGRGAVSWVRCPSTLGCEDRYVEIDAGVKLPASPRSRSLPPLRRGRAPGCRSRSSPACSARVAARALQDWEQGPREPAGAARALLKVAVLHREVLRQLRR